MATQQQLADHLDLTVRRVRQLADAGVLPKPARGAIDIDECRVSYIRYLRDRVPRGGAPVQTDGVLDPHAERARKDAETADKLAMENALRRNELVEIAEVASTWIRICTEAKARLLGLPTKAAPLVIGCSRVPQVKAILEEQVIDAMGQLGDTVAGIVGGVTPARTVDDKRVGRSVSRAQSRGKRRAR